jgi:hypothetical protein
MDESLLSDDSDCDDFLGSHDYDETPAKGPRHRSIDVIEEEEDEVRTGNYLVRI